MFAVLGFLLVGELTHMRSMCVGVAETGVEHRSPAIIHKDTFSFLVLFTDEKYQKSYKRRSTSYISPPVASRRPVRTHFPDRPVIAEPRLQVRNAPAPTRIRYCAMSGYGKPRGSDLGACLGANIAR